MTKEHRIEANGLEHRVLEWPGPGKPVFLVHGFMDAAATWDRVAHALAKRDLRVFAPDMRGFGEGGRAPRGSYYHFSDYIADLAGLASALSPKTPIGLVGHSMGGTIATLYSGAFPETVDRLAVLEGLGPPDNPFEVGPTRMRRWIEDLRSVRAPSPMSREDARARLTANHPRVAPEVIDRLLPELVRESGDGVVWRFDPLHRTTSPVPFFAKLFVEFAKRVTCPVLFVSGGSLGFHVEGEDERLAAFARVQRVTLEDAGHMMHWTRPEALGAELARFLF